MKTFITLAAIISTLWIVPAARAARSMPANMLAQVSKATWIAERKSSHIIYVFFDPNCAGCHFLYESLRPFIRAEQVQVRWLPVAVVDATSLGKAAAILQSAHPLSALAYNEEHYRPENGGIEEALPAPEIGRQVRANTRLLNVLPIPVVPTMLFADKTGHATLIQGALTPLALRKAFARLP